MILKIFNQVFNHVFTYQVLFVHLLKINVPHYDMYLKFYNFILKGFYIRPKKNLKDVIIKLNKDEMYKFLN